MVNNVVKFVFLGIVFVALAGAIIYGIGYWKYQNSPEYRAEKDLKALEKKYAEDPYGGDTPEETLRLFIDALKKGDTDLAVKYFILDKQEEWKEDLAKIKEKNLLGEMIKDLERKKYKHSISDSMVGFDIANDQNQGALSISLSRGPKGKWKILDL